MIFMPIGRYLKVKEFEFVADTADEDDTLGVSAFDGFTVDEKRKSNTDNDRYGVYEILMVSNECDRKFAEGDLILVEDHMIGSVKAFDEDDKFILENYVVGKYVHTVPEPVVIFRETVPIPYGTGTPHEELPFIVTCKSDDE